MTDAAKNELEARSRLPGARGRAAFTAIQIAGLAGTAYLVWNGSLMLRLRDHSAAAVITDSILYVLVAWMCSAALTLVLSTVFLGRDAEGAVRLALRTSRTAVWFAPACLLLPHRSPAALIPALALITGTTQMLYSQWAAMRPAEPSGAPPEGPFQLLPSPRIIRALAPAVVTALLLQGSLAARMTRRPLLAAFMLAVAIALLTLMLLAGGVVKPDRKQELPRAIYGILLTVILASGITAVHMVIRYGPSGSGWGDSGPFASFREAMRDAFSGLGGEGPDERRVERARFDGGFADPGKDVFPGIVLVPEVKPFTTLVAPAPAWLKSSAALKPERNYGIPFSGEYWMFRPPYLRPPEDAHLITGNPAALSFKTNDNSRMNMEARQKLDRNIEIKCCRAIQIAISNADLYPGTIALELFLIDRHEGESALRLGRNRVTSWPDAKPDSGGPIRPVPETLEFPIPSSSIIIRFNELRVVIHRDLVRSERSARLSIERFILVPREM